MTTSSATLHEPAERLRQETVDRHRAVVSLIEELEAMDWYDQRVDAAGDEELRSILKHNRDEEKEHALMLFEWLRRQDPVLDANCRKYLFTEGSITTLEENEESGEAKAAALPGSDNSLGIGSLKGGKK